MTEKIKIKLDNGKIIERKPRFKQFGNFQMMIVRYNNEDYLVGDGDEYLRGHKDVYTLKKKLS